MHRWFLFLAAGLVASLAFVSESQAGSIVTGVADFTIITPAAVTASDIELFFSPGVLPAVPPPLTILPGTTLTITSVTSVGDVLTLNFLPASTGIVNFSFASAAAPGAVSLVSPIMQLTGLSAPINLFVGGAGVSAVAVPEPTSMALLGVGMAGFFAYRRLFKRPVTA